MHRMLATALSILYVLTSNPGFAASRQGQTPSEAPSNLKKQLAMLRTGTVVEVRLRQRGSEKITGKLGSMTDQGFEVQTVKSGTVSSEKVAFADVQSVKKKGMSRMKKLVVIGIVVGVLWVVGAIGATGALGGTS
jgi:hypothetical protein